MEKFIDIDIKIAPLINEIWKAQINTSNSCEDNDMEKYEGDKDFHIWIDFISENDLLRFLKIIFKNISFDNDIFQRAYFSNSNSKLKWYLDIFFDIFQKKNLVKELFLYYGVTFPRCDYMYVLTKFCQYNKKHDVVLNEYKNICAMYKKNGIFENNSIKTQNN